mmetsp:Transcript_4475/g.6679  ORF Transcript_4475/g.6679 Transcript_4475/m.6679 type:complete len:103 (-) Transcript_4475:1181-1489(-)
MKRQMNKALTGNVDLVSLADLAEIALENGHTDIAIRYSEEGIASIMPLHAERLRFYCIMIRAHFALENYKEAERYFQIATDTLFHHLGPSHPLHITIYGIMA